MDTAGTEMQASSVPLGHGPSLSHNRGHTRTGSPPPTQPGRCQPPPFCLRGRRAATYGRAGCNVLRGQIFLPTLLGDRKARLPLRAGGSCQSLLCSHSRVPGLQPWPDSLVVTPPLHARTEKHKQPLPGPEHGAMTALPGPQAVSHVNHCTTSGKDCYSPSSQTYAARHLCCHAGPGRAGLGSSSALSASPPRAGGVASAGAQQHPVGQKALAPPSKGPGEQEPGQSKQLDRLNKA